MTAPAIVWLRQDLRLADNPALAAAATRGGPVVPVYIWSPEEEGGLPPGGATGLYHVAILYPTRAALAEALRRVLAAGVELEGAADHGVSEALYRRDPDENGVEVYRDRPKEHWPYTWEGGLDMSTRALNIDELLKEK
jgi:catechol 2,3-dioxygenase